MNHKLHLVAAYLYILFHITLAADKWSRQLESTGPGSETYDWIPVAQPVDTKDRAGRVITYQQNFPPNVPFGELQKHNHVPSSQPIQTFGFPFHFQRFQQPQTQNLSPQPLLSQPQLHQQAIQPSKHNIQQPTSQSFFKFEMPFNRDGNRNQENSQGVQTGYQIQHSSFGAQQSLFQPPLLSQKQFFPPEFHPLQRPQSHQNQQPQPPQQSFIEESVKHQSNSPSAEPESPTFPNQQTFDLQKPASFQSQLPFHASAVAAPVPSTSHQQEKDVQLLYVPYDTLYNQQRNENPIFENSQFNVGSHQQINPYQINNFYMPETTQAHVPNKFTTSTTAKPPTTTTFKTTSYQHYPQYTTPKPKPKAHQPPLAMFLLKSSNYPTEIDVVNALKNAKTIDVLDAPNQRAPSVFVGPAGMQTPNGYAKFELPYLSQLTHGSNIEDKHFFVAPLSYRTPAGFNKILLPEPHVGSIVINKQKDVYDLKNTNRPSILPISQIDVYNQAKYSNQLASSSQKGTYSDIRELPPTSTPSPQLSIINGIRDIDPHSQNQQIFITPNQNEIQDIPSTPPTSPGTTQKIKSSTPKEYFHDVIREVHKLNRNRFPYETTTQRIPTIPYRGNKYSEIPTNKFPEPIEEINSPQNYKQERLKPTYQLKRPESQYAQFRPIPNNIPPEDFYKVQPIRANPPTTSTSTPTTKTTASNPPRTYFTQSYPTSPQINFQSTRGQVYHNDEKSNIPDEDHYTTPLVPQTSNPSDEHRMKQYFRHQEAFRNRPSFPTTTPPAPVENVSYTPVSVDYDREVKIPSSTPSYMTTTSSKLTTHRQRLTYYHPTTTTTPYEEITNIVPENKKTFEYPGDSNIETTNTPSQDIFVGQTKPPYRIPINSKTKNHLNDMSTTETPEVEFEPNPYQLPSELPPLTPNLPGLVNGLIEQNKLAGETKTTIQMDVTTTSTPEIRPTRRLINRMKKPVISKVSQSVSYSSSDYSTRRPINRIRRPLSGRNYTTSTTSTTIRPSSSRVPIIRNPNRIRYNPTPEERQTLRIKSKKHGSSGKNDDNSDDLEYQRDVLKQNYPVFRPSTKKTTTTPTMPTPSKTIEQLTLEQQQMYTVTPSSEQNFDELIEPMQIAQQYQEYPQNNYGPGYFPNEEEIMPTEAALRNEISPTLSSTSSTEEPQPTTKRPPFIRRGPRIKTTTEAPTSPVPSNTDINDETFTVRTRVPPRRVVKVRARTRRPYTAPSTTIPSEEDVESEPKKNNFNKLNKFNQELFQDERRQRVKSQFHLEPQESQWSPSLSGKNPNSFRPMKPKDYKIVTKSYENEPEIVTAKVDVNKSDSYLFNVSAGFGSTANSNLTPPKNKNESSALKKSEKSFADLLEEVMSDIGKESDMKSPESFFESQKMDNPNRRAKWKNSNTGETFETAESQNIGAQLFNSLYTGTMEKSTESILKQADVYGTTHLPEKTILTTTTPAPTPTTLTESESDLLQNTLTPNIEHTTSSSLSSEQVTTEYFDNESTINEPESITERIDDLWNVEDLDSQPSMFLEVRKQLNELFKATQDENEDNQGDVEFVQPHKHEYTNIHRVKNSSGSVENMTDITVKGMMNSENHNMFHENLMESVVYATSTSNNEDKPETEICYRGHCIRSEDLPPNHKLH